jgi:hypothetical protein
MVRHGPGVVRKLLPHFGAALFFVLAAAVTMRGWFVYDRIPVGDFAGYAAVVQYVRDMLLEHGRVPAWSPYFGGSTWFMSSTKEYLTFPLALWLEPLLAVKVMFVLTRIAAALGMYAIFVRGFGSRCAGLLAGYAFAFGNLANHQERHLDIAVSYALFAWLTFATLELLRRKGWRAAICVGILAGTLFSNNYVQGMVYPVLVLLLLALRPWEPFIRIGDPAASGRTSRSVVPPLTLALALATLFGASQLVWFVADLDHHALLPDVAIERSRSLFIVQSPVFLLNRNNWLGPWLADHAPPGLEGPVDAFSVFASNLLRDELYWSNHYLGAVLLCTSAAGWFAARRQRPLRRWFQTFGLLFVLQYWLALGPRTLVWQIGRSFDWSESLDATLQWAVGSAALVALAVALALAATHRRGPRMEACLAFALLCVLASQPLLEVASAVFAPLGRLRSPGHFFDLATFSAAAVLGGAWVAIEGMIGRPGIRPLLASAVALALVVDYWPSTRVFERGKAAAPNREFEEHFAGLEGEGRSLRIGFGRVCDSRCSLLAGTSRAGFASDWLRWHAPPYWGSFMDAASPIAGPKRKPQSETLTRMGRIKYSVQRSGERLRPPWKELAQSPDFALWQRPDVLPMAYGFRAYLVSLSPNQTLVRWELIESALRRNIVVITGPERLAEAPPELLEGAALLRASEHTLDDAASAGLAERYSEALLAGEWPKRSSVWLEPRGPLLDVDYRRDAPEHIALEVDAGSEPAIIFVSESYHPWWVARVDSQPASVLRAGNVFIAVRVGPGRHHIELELERPPVVVAGDAATRTGWLALMFGLPLYAAVSWRRRRGAA